jgi:S1-C subfamily serine protease
MILCTIAFPSFARADSKTIVVKLWVGNQYMDVNEVRKPIDAQGTKPVILESRTLVPIRAIIEAFGGTVGWDANTKEVSIYFNNNTLELWIGQAIASLNGYSVQIDSANPKVVPLIINSRTMIPLRFVAESFGIDIQYEATTKMITLTYISIQVPGTPTLLTPVDNASIKSGNISFTWTTIDGVDYYRIKILKGNSIVNSNDNVSFNFYTIARDVLGEGTYSWQVAAHNSAGWGSWSSVNAFTITVQLPSAPTLIFPTTDSTLNSSTITFTWSSVAGADSYKIQILKESITIHTTDNIATNSYTLTGIDLADGEYSWQVSAHNSAGWGSWSSAFVFTIKKQLSITDIAKFVDRVVYVEVSGYSEGKPFTASGSGFIISSDGTVVTNYHVIDHATSGTVTLNDGTKYDIVTVLGYAKPKEVTDKDIAVIKINASNLPVCTLGDSDKVQVGESVVAIGSPLGLPNVVSNGIVSKVWGEGIIQITAPISPGNSGGPLFNMYGEVIGINTFKLVPGENLNFALPINWVKTLDTSLNMTLQQVYEKEYGSVPSLPGTPVLISPSNEAFLTTTTPSFTWTSVADIDYYGIVVMEGSVKDQDKIIWAAFPTTTSITIPSGKLQAGKTYTWVVVTHNSYGYGNDSEAWHFSIAKPQLTPPILLTPEDKESIVPSIDGTTIKFSWVNVLGASYYVLWIGLGLSGTDETKVYSKKTTSTSFNLSTYTLSAGNIYTWAVGAVDSSEEVYWSVDKHFSIAKEKTISLLYPGDQSIIYSTTPQMIWLPMLGADSYILGIFDATYSPNISVLSKKVVETIYTVPYLTLTKGHIYYWLVMAIANGYIIGTSELYIFSIYSY